jgi:hypothetical protein
MIKCWIDRMFSSEVELLPIASEAEPLQRFWVIPGAKGLPRWIIPHNACFGLSTLRQWRPYDFTSVLKWQILLAAYRLGGLSVLPGVSDIGLSLKPSALKSWPTIWESLGWQGSEAPIPIIYIGTPGSTRKLVVLLVDPATKQPQVVLKIPLEPKAAKAISHEASILVALHQFNPILGPSLVSHNDVEGIASQSFISSKPMGRKLLPAHIDWLIKLKTSQTRQQSDPIEDLANRFQIISEYSKSSTVNPDMALKALEKLSRLSQFPTVWEHGDFAPWNIRYTEDGGLVAVDWEESKTCGLPMMDLFYFSFIQDYLSNRADSIPRKIRECALFQRYMTEFNLSLSDVDNLYQYFKLMFLCRQLEREEINPLLLVRLGIFD